MGDPDRAARHMATLGIAPNRWLTLASVGRVRVAVLCRSSATIVRRSWRSRSGRATLAGLQEIGFKRVTLSDGYYLSYVYDLEPQSEDGGGKLALAGLGLDKPISM